MCGNVKMLCTHNHKQMHSLENMCVVTNHRTKAHTHTSIYRHLFEDRMAKVSTYTTGNM